MCLPGKAVNNIPSGPTASLREGALVCHHTLFPQPSDFGMMGRTPRLSQDSLAIALCRSSGLDFTGMLPAPAVMVHNGLGTCHDSCGSNKLQLPDGFAPLRLGLQSLTQADHDKSSRIFFGRNPVGCSASVNAIRVPSLQHRGTPKPIVLTKAVKNKYTLLSKCIHNLAIS